MRLVNLRTLTAQCREVMSGITTWSRDPSGSDESTNGELRSTRRPDDCNMRSTRSRTSPSVSTRSVGCGMPWRATKILSGALIQISSTDSSSKYGWSGPNPVRVAMASLAVRASSASNGNAPPRARSLYLCTSSCTYCSAMPSLDRSTPSRRTRSRTRSAMIETAWDMSTSVPRIWKRHPELSTGSKLRELTARDSVDGVPFMKTTLTTDTRAEPDVRQLHRAEHRPRELPALVVFQRNNPTKVGNSGVGRDRSRATPARPRGSAATRRAARHPARSRSAPKHRGATAPDAAQSSQPPAPPSSRSAAAPQ